MSVTDRRYEDIRAMTMRCTEQVWSEQRPCLQLDALLSTIVNSWQSYVCTQCCCQHDWPLTWALQCFSSVSTIFFFILHLLKQHSLSHHTAQPGCMYHMTSPCKAGTCATHWADTAVGLPTCWQMFKYFICSLHEFHLCLLDFCPRWWVCYW